MYAEENNMEILADNISISEQEVIDRFFAEPTEKEKLAEKEYYQWLERRPVSKLFNIKERTEYDNIL